jgi:hypothetical protein
MVYQSMFGFLSALLLALLFILQPTSDKDLIVFQKEVHSQFAQATTELVAGESLVEPFAFIWSTVNSFYDQSANEALALIQPDEAFSDLVMSFIPSYHENLKVASAPFVTNLPHEEPIYNIVPMNDAEALLDPYFSHDLLTTEGGVVAGESIDISREPFDGDTQVDNLENNNVALVPVTWVTINDSITGAPNCVAIFDGTVNTYPGSCAQENAIIEVYEN